MPATIMAIANARNTTIQGRVSGVRSSSMPGRRATSRKVARPSGDAVTPVDRRTGSGRIAAHTPRPSLPRPAAKRSPPLTNPSTAMADDVAPAVAELDTIVSLAKRRGFVYPSSEIYGGINAVWDYGPLGVELKNNVKRAWWKVMVQERDDIVGLDAGILMAAQVWVTSGHVGSFSDPMVECQTDKRRFRLDELPGAESLTATELRDPGIVEKLGLKCPVDGGPLSAPRRFNLMFK